MCKKLFQRTEVKNGNVEKTECHKFRNTVYFTKTKTPVKENLCLDRFEKLEYA